MLNVCCLETAKFAVCVCVCVCVLRCRRSGRQAAETPVGRVLISVHFKSCAVMEARHLMQNLTQCSLLWCLLVYFHIF
jgi:hypothetical protein